MILQALNELYQRLARDEESGIPLRGFSRQPVPFALEIDRDGTLRQVLDLRVQNGKKLAPRQLIVPEPAKRSGTKPPPNFMWDNTGYVLGADNKGKPKRAAWAFGEFRKKTHVLCDDLDDEGAAAVLAFLDAWSPDKAAGLDHWDELCGLNVVFKLSTERNFVHERPKIREAWLRHAQANASEVHGQCLVTGEEHAPIARLHPDLKGVRGAQSKGATLVGFNLDAFASYAKSQSYNAPVGEEAAFNYTTALNHLLRRDSPQKVQIGDATTVFWTERKTTSEELFPFAFDPSEDEAEQKKLALFLEAVRDGKMPVALADERQVRTYVLGLSPNAGRISVRFWHVDTVEGMWGKLRQHFADLRIVRRFEKEPEFPPQWLLLKAAALREDLDNLSPLLAGAFMRSILTGGAYPESLLAAVMGRIRAEHEVTYCRAAIVKACIVRNARLHPDHNTIPEVTVSLDETSINVPYRLGRLFAVLEKLQEEAYFPNKLNSTIMDKYYGSASATPRSVFPILMKLKVHHLRKFPMQKRGLAINRERTIAAILDGVDISDGGFPAHLSLEDQGLFTLGYYHQRKALWTPGDAATEAKPETANPATEE